MSRVITLHLPYKKIITQTNILDYAEYHYGQGYIDIRLSSKLAPYLLGLKRDFTRYKLSQIIGLSSNYAIRIYEMLKKQENIEARTFILDDFRTKIGLSPGILPEFKNFRRKVLEIAKREINLKTDIIIDFTFVKIKKEIVAIKFSITPKNPENKQLKFLEWYENKAEPDNQHLATLMEYGFDQKEASALLAPLSEHVILNALSAVTEQIDKGKCKNPRAMLRTALVGAWSPSIKSPPRPSTSITAKKRYSPLKKSVSLPVLLPKTSIFSKFIAKLFGR
jgi:hypothetical protein